MYSNNTISLLQARSTAVQAELDVVLADLAAAQALYAAPVLVLDTNNGQGYEMSLRSAQPEGAEQLMLVHTPTDGEPVGITLAGTEQLAPGLVEAQWRFADGVTSEVATITVS